MSTPRHLLIPAVVLAAALLGACGGDDGDSESGATADPAAETSTSTATPAAGSDQAAEAGRVTIERSRFDPETLDVTTGSEVTFENLDPYAHTVTSAEGSPLGFDSGELGQDETFSQTFDEPGTYGYFCEIHPTMRAEVVVS